MSIFQPSVQPSFFLSHHPPFFVLPPFFLSLVFGSGISVAQVTSAMLSKQLKGRHGASPPPASSSSLFFPSLASVKCHRVDCEAASRASATSASDERRGEKKKKTKSSYWSNLQGSFFLSFFPKLLKKKKKKMQGKSEKVTEVTGIQDGSRKCFLIGSERAGHFWIPRELLI